MRIYVGNLPPNATGAQVIALFEQIGPVCDMQLVSDPAMGQARGFGFVEMADDQAAAQAIKALNGYKLEGQKLKVSQARPERAQASPDVLFAANLPAEITEQQLHDVFSACGEVASVQLTSGKGTARVRMATDEASRAAWESLNGCVLNGQRLAVSPYAAGRPARLDDDLRALIERLADVLSETESGPIGLLRSVTQYCGPAFARSLLDETQAVEQNGGLLVVGGQRRRTPGGVFLYLARSRMSGPMRAQVFPGRATGSTAGPKAPHRASGAAPQEQESQWPAFKWSQRATIQEQLLQQKGTATTVKVTLIGRPGAVERRQQDLVITTMSHTPKDTLTLPKGVPRPPATETLYTLYIAAKQWGKVEDALRADPDDVLIVEGLCAFDADVRGIAVFAQSVTTKRLQQAKNVPAGGDQASIRGQAAPTPTPKAQAQPPTKAPTQTGVPSSAKGMASPTAVTTRPAPMPAVAPDKRGNLPAQTTSGLDAAQAARKLAQLRQAEQEARERLDSLKALPPEEQTGMAQALQTLQRVKGEIAALRREFPRLA